MKIFLSIRPKLIGGGSNTFSVLFKKWAKQNGHKIVKKILKADLAIVIAHLAQEHDLAQAKANGCRIVHRLDEYFEQNEDKVRRKKHDKIVLLNGYADLTVFQSQFVYRNVQPVLKSENNRIIYNGGDHKKFSPASKPGNYIGHVTWGIAEKKRLDLLHNFITNHPEEQFLLIGRHKSSQYDFKLPNVKLVGKVRRWSQPKYFRKMKLLYFPSENDPCPNTVIEAILSGVPVCYNSVGGAIELVRGRPDRIGFLDTKVCGLPLNRVNEMMSDLCRYRENCFNRSDLHFDKVFEQYLKD